MPPVINIQRLLTAVGHELLAYLLEDETSINDN